MAAFEHATVVPGTAAYVVGLIQVRGHLIPVVDLRQRFGLVAAESRPEARVIIIRQGGRVVGLLADRAREVLALGEEDFQAPPELVKEQGSGFVQAVARHNGRLLLRIDSEKVIGKDSFNGERN
jgi:purine-binding chemotaxis protein CheW